MTLCSMGKNKPINREGDLEVLEMTVHFNRVIRMGLTENMKPKRGRQRADRRGRGWEGKVARRRLGSTNAKV